MNILQIRKHAFQLASRISPDDWPFEKTLKAADEIAKWFEGDSRFSASERKDALMEIIRLHPPPNIDPPPPLKDLLADADSFLDWMYGGQDATCSR